MFIIQAEVYKIQFFFEGGVMRQFKSVKLIASFKTQKEVKECLKKQEFFETLMQKVKAQFTPDELELLFTLHPHFHSTAPTTQKQSYKQGLGGYRIAAPKKQQSPLEEISLDVFSSSGKKRIRKIVTFEKEQAGEQSKHIQRPSISTPKIKRKIINNLICASNDELKQNKRATSEISKPPPRSLTKTASYKFSRPKYRGANSASKEKRQFLSNPRVLQTYNSQFLDSMFRTKTEQDHSENTLIAESGSAWDNYLAGKSEEDKKYRSIERLKVGRHKTVGVRS